MQPEMGRAAETGDEFDALILAGRKLAAIKAYRLTTGASLDTARKAVEARAATLRAAGHQLLTPQLTPAERARFVAVLVMGVVFCAVFAFIIFGGWTQSQTIGSAHTAR
jgi:hypothetical protein